MARKFNSLKVHKKDNIDKAIEKNEKLMSMVRNLQKENSKLKSENKTLKEAWRQTESKWKKEVKDVSLEEIFKSIQNGKSVRKLRRQCKDCGSRKMKKLNYDKFEIVICSQCGYRDKIDK